MDNFGHEVIEQAATGAGPCRVSLKPFNIGIDKRLVFTHSPFAIDNPYHQTGPVFINSKHVDEYKNVCRFPPEIKADKKSFPITLIGYIKEQRMIFTKLVGNADIDDLINKIFVELTAVDYLHVTQRLVASFVKLSGFSYYHIH